MAGPFTFPVAQAIPFEPNRNPQYGGNAGPSGLTSDEVQSAVEEAKATALGTSSRYLAQFDYQGGANNHWLEFGRNLPSDFNPHVIAEGSTLRAISVVTNKTKPTNATFTIYKNAVSLTTFTITNAYKGFVSSLTFNFVPGDEISIFAVQNAGAANPLTSPAMQLFIRVNQV